MGKYGETSTTVKPIQQLHDKKPRRDTLKTSVHHKQNNPMQKNIRTLMQQAHDKASSAIVLEQLHELQGQGTSEFYADLAFWKLRLLLQYQHASAMDEALYLINAYPDHPLLARTYLWIVKWQKQLSKQDTLYFTGKAMQSAQHEPIIQEAIALGEMTAQHSQAKQAAPWYLYAANADKAQRKYWLGQLSAMMTETLLVNMHFRAYPGSTGSCWAL